MPVLLLTLSFQPSTGQAFHLIPPHLTHQVPMQGLPIRQSILA